MDKLNHLIIFDNIKNDFFPGINEHRKNTSIAHVNFENNLSKKLIGKVDSISLQNNLRGDKQFIVLTKIRKINKFNHVTREETHTAFPFNKRNLIALAKKLDYKDKKMLDSVVGAIGSKKISENYKYDGKVINVATPITINSQPRESKGKIDNFKYKGTYNLQTGEMTPGFVDKENSLKESLYSSFNKKRKE